MDRPLCSFALRLALPTLALALWTGCGHRATPTSQAAKSLAAPRRLATSTGTSSPAQLMSESSVVACAADGPVLASPAGESAAYDGKVSVGAGDPRVSLRKRLRKIQDLADEAPAETQPAPAPAEPVKPETSKQETVEAPAIVAPTKDLVPPTKVAEVPVAEAPVPVPWADLRPVPQTEQPAAPPAKVTASASQPVVEPIRDALTTKPYVPSSEECPQTRLPWADRPIHSAAMDAVTRQANECTQHGYELAARGATYSARAELIRALRLIAQALDAQYDTRNHGKALAAGLRALSEADDFVPRASRVEAELNVPLLVSSHQTPVLKNEPTEGITPLVARQRYYMFAQEQLGAAAGREPAGSLALYALGKIQPTLTTAMDADDKTADPKAITYYRAALITDATNYMAANDLGVLLARYGMWREARGVLVQSLSIAPQSATWRNLAIVHQQLGEADLANRAQSESQALAVRERQGRPASESAPDVQWMTPEAFANTKSSAQFDTVQMPKDTAAKAPATTRK